MTRLAATSPVATRTGATARAMRAWPRMSAPAGPPTFIFTSRHPAAAAARTSALTFSSGYPSQPTEVVYAG